MAGDDICAWLAVFGVIAFVVLVLLTKSVGSVWIVVLLMVGAVGLTVVCAVVVGMLFVLRMILRENKK